MLTDLVGRRTRFGSASDQTLFAFVKSKLVFCHRTRCAACVIPAQFSAINKLSINKTAEKLVSLLFMCFIKMTNAAFQGAREREREK